MIDENVDIKRIIGEIGEPDERTVVFFGGIHGNEPSGVIAIQEVFEEIKNLPIKGKIIGVYGNKWALQNNQRFHTQDLNRLWKTPSINKLESGDFFPNNPDEEEQLDIFNLLQKQLRNNKKPLYFCDLHTTSSKTIPFITVNDSLLNRKFTNLYPCPKILGIEEFLEGPLLSYINELGYVSFGFEAGQHEDPISVANHKAFIYLTLVFTGVISKESIDFNKYWMQLSELTSAYKNFYEITQRHQIAENEKFKMFEGFSNFQKIKKGEDFALSNGETISATKESSIFMPLYQDKGNDGYFLIQDTSPFFLRLSGIVRKLKLDSIFPLLPGVSWENSDRNTMNVDLRIAKFIAKPMFHLFGYRAQEWNDTILKVKNREYNSKTRLYHDEKWFNNIHY